MDIMKIMQAVCEKYEWDHANEYGERGYQNSTTSVIVIVGHDGPDLWGNKYPRIQAAMRDAGIELESYDEWYVDWENGGKAWRTEPDSYMWQSALGYGDGFVLTPDDDAEAWIEWALDNDAPLNRERLPEDALLDAGFQYWPDDENEYQNGWHQGMTDDPKKIRERILESLSDVSEDAIDIIFYVHENSQFYISFKAFVRVNWITTTISSNGFSHDMQVDDALSYLEQFHPDDYRQLNRDKSVENRVLDGAWFDTEAMGCDIEWSSWIADEIEATGHVFWDEGEPYARIKPERLVKP